MGGGRSPLLITPQHLFHGTPFPLYRHTGFCITCMPLLDPGFLYQQCFFNKHISRTFSAVLGPILCTTEQLLELLGAKKLCGDFFPATSFSRSPNSSFLLFVLVPSLSPAPTPTGKIFHVEMLLCRMQLVNNILLILLNLCY